jgi:hypothetical protein
MAVRLKNFAVARLGSTPPAVTSSPFTFVVSDRRYVCPWFVAAMLAPKLAVCRAVDLSINEYIVQTPDPHRRFKWFLTLGEGRTLRMQPERMGFVHELCAELGCLDDLEVLGALHSESQATLANVGSGVIPIRAESK